MLLNLPYQVGLSYSSKLGELKYTKMFGFLDCMLCQNEYRFLNDAPESLIELRCCNSRFHKNCLETMEEDVDDKCPKCTAYLTLGENISFNASLIKFLFLFF